MLIVERQRLSHRQRVFACIQGMQVIASVVGQGYDRIIGASSGSRSDVIHA
jgi:hypothetical protein